MTQTAIFGVACSQNPSSCDSAITIFLDPTTLPTTVHTGPLYVYVSCSTPTMVGARLYWYTKAATGSKRCDPADVQSCDTSYYSYPEDPAGILAGEVTDPGHASNVIGTDRAPMIGHIGSLATVTPTEAEASGQGLDSATTRVSFSFTSGIAPSTICSSSNTSTTTGCMPSTCSWIDLETSVSSGTEALLSAAGNEITCPFAVWPHRAGLTYLRLCVESSTRFNIRNDTTMYSGEQIDARDVFCFLWKNIVGDPTVTPKNAVPFNLTETWSSISRDEMDVYGGQVTYVRGNGECD